MLSGFNNGQQQQQQQQQRQHTEERKIVIESSLQLHSSIDSYSTISEDERSFFWTTNKHKLAIIVIAYVTGFGISALIFQWLETLNENQLRNELLKAHQTFLAKNANIDVDSLRSFLIAIEKARRNGIEFDCLNDKNWDYTSSLLFVSSILTTIGYGNVTPNTDYGKIMSIFFAILGIPSTIFILLSVVKILLKGPVILLESWIVWNLYRLHSVTSLMFIQILHLITVAIVVVIFVFLIPATIFWNLEENWTFLDSVYYCFITATTIGLGDFVPGQTVNTPLYRIATMIYMFFGVLMMMLLIAVIKRIPIFNFEKILRLEEVQEDSKTIERIKVITGHDYCECSQIIDHHNQQQQLQHHSYGTNENNE